MSCPLVSIVHVPEHDDPIAGELLQNSGWRSTFLLRKTAGVD